jgi:hypothetical protein
MMDVRTPTNQSTPGNAQGYQDALSGLKGKHSLIIHHFSIIVCFPALHRTRTAR